MRRTALLAAAVLAALPSAAVAKTGLSFDSYPDISKVGAAIPFTMHIYREPPASGGRATPVHGIRTLVTFKSRSGRVIRVRTRRTDRFGVAHGSVRFTDKGPWVASYDLKRRGIWTGAESSEPIHVGIGLTQTIPSVDQQRQGARVGPGFPWAWVLSLAAAASLLLAFALRRRHWGAA